MEETTGQPAEQTITEDKDEYVKRLSVASCSCGTKDFCQYLNLPKDHGIYYQDNDHPLMNANDHKGGDHVMHFGRCSSSLNPKNAAAEVLGKISPLFGAIDMIKDAVGSEGCQCSPRTLTSWNVPNKDNRLDGAPAITRECDLVCIYGGIITITDDPDASASTENGEAGQKEETEQDILDTLPKDMENKIRQMNSDADAMAAEAMEWYAENADIFTQAYGCTPQMSAQNYSSNSTQMIPADSINDAGFLTGAAGLSNFNVAGANAAAIGGGCVAAFNALQALGSPMGFPEVIRGVEQQQSIPGIIDQGPVAVSMLGLASLFSGLGFAAKMSFPMALSADSLELEQGEVAILGTTHKRGAADGFMEEAARPVMSSRELAGKYNTRQNSSAEPLMTSRSLAAQFATGSVAMQGARTAGKMASKSLKGQMQGNSALGSKKPEAATGMKKAVGKQALGREASFCTITRGEKGLMCAEMPDRPIADIFQEKSEGTMMLMKVTK